MRQTPSPGTLTLPGMEDVGLSPIRRQYLELKRRQPDAILLFRLGDFYETFEDDAHLAARVLDITLTSREMGPGQGPSAVELVVAELVRIGPAEILVQSDESLDGLAPPGAALTRRGPELFAPLAATRAVVRCFGGVPESSGLSEHPLALRALGGLLAYVQEARPAATRTLQHPRLFAIGGTMVLDRATRRNLDLLEPSAGEGSPSLLRVLDRTSTPMGARLLRAILGQPLLDPERINARLDAVERLVGDANLRARLAATLRGVPDLERLAIRAGQHLLMPRECLALAAGLERVPRIQHALTSAADLPPLLDQARPRAAPEVIEDVRATVREGATVFEEGVIRPGVSAELDQHRTLAGDARQWIAALETRERERTGVRGAGGRY